MNKIARLTATMLPLFLLSACLLTPGKFASTLDVRADRSFTFTYVGELVVSKESGPAMPVDLPDANEGDEPESDGTAYFQQIATKPKVEPGKEALPDSDQEAKIRSIADALAKEEGFRSVRYSGGDKILVDYQIKGRLDHSFIFPFNIDAQAIIPFVAIEVRKDGKVRIQAPGFGDEGGKSFPGPMGGGGNDDTKDRNGTFTLTTDTEIVSQNQEDGAKAVPGGKQIVWKITPQTRTAPMAVLQLAAHP